MLVLSIMYHQKSNPKINTNHLKFRGLSPVYPAASQDWLGEEIDAVLVLRRFLKAGNPPFDNGFPVIRAGGHDDL